MGLHQIKKLLGEQSFFIKNRGCGVSGKSLVENNFENTLICFLEAERKMRLSSHVLAPWIH
jgi:hypothetical protein